MVVLHHKTQISQMKLSSLERYVFLMMFSKCFFIAIKSYFSKDYFPEKILIAHRMTHLSSLPQLCRPLSSSPCCLSWWQSYASYFIQRSLSLKCSCLCRKLLLLRQRHREPSRASQIIPYSQIFFLFKLFLIQPFHFHQEW